VQALAITPVTNGNRRARGPHSGPYRGTALP